MHLQYASRVPELCLTYSRKFYSSRRAPNSQKVNALQFWRLARRNAMRNSSEPTICKLRVRRGEKCSPPACLIQSPTAGPRPLCARSRPRPPFPLLHFVVGLMGGPVLLRRRWRLTQHNMLSFSSSSSLSVSMNSGIDFEIWMIGLVG